MNKAKIAEIFKSIQGEGKYVGEEQIFIRFSGCNLACAYCDTEHLQGKEYNTEDLVKEIEKYNPKTVHSISLTGGEPLLHADFINDFAQRIDTPIYLETNSSLPEELQKVIKNVDFIAADIKLSSCTNQENKFDLHKEFLKIAKDNNTDTFLKIVYNKNITEEEIKQCINIAKEFDYEIFLQPQMTETDFAFNIDNALSVFKNFRAKYNKVRFLPQMHKFWKVK